MSSQRLRPITGLILALIVAAACGGGTPSASPSASATAASVAPSSAAPSATPTASSTAAPSVAVIETPAEAAAALAAYIEAVADPDRSFHLVQTASIILDGNRLGDAHYLLDVSKGDISADLEVLGQSVGIVAVADQMWIQQGTGDWTEVTRDDSVLADVLDIFRYTGDPTALAFVETTAEGGTTLHTFRNAAPLPYQTSAMKDLGVTGSIPTLTLVIGDDGTPKVIRFSSSAEMPVGGAANQRVESDSTIAFTKFGEVIEIKSPV